MNNTQKKRAYTKSRLIKELSFRAGITQNQSRAALEAIIEIAYREARANFFVLPGLCKFSVVHRNERSVRNPSTGEMLMLPPREALHVALSKRAKETVVPRVAPMKLEEYEAWKKEHMPAVEEPAPPAPVAEEPAPAPVAEASVASVEEPKPVEESVVAAEPPPVPEEPLAVAEAEPPAAVEAEPPAVTEEPVAETAPVSEDQPAVEEPPTAEEAAPAAEPEGPEISFKCPTCGQEVIAPSDAIGCEAECPVCGSIVIVPERSEPGTACAVDGDANKEIIADSEAGDIPPEKLKNRTIRIDASMFDDVAGNDSSANKMADAMKNTTMRIDLPDEF